MKAKDEYEPSNHYSGEGAEKVTDADREYAEVHVTLPSKVLAVTVEESPREVTRMLLDADV